MNEPKQINDGGPAFPHSVQRLQSSYHQEIKGMSLRDWFAGMAMSGLMANSGGPIQSNGMNGWSFCNCTTDDVARLAHKMADAMLAAGKEAR